MPKVNSNWKFSSEEIEWLREHVPGWPMWLTMERFKARFGYHSTRRALQAACHRRGIKTGNLSNCIVEGRKQCSKSSHWRPVGSEMVDNHGYIQIKMNDDYGDRRVRWKMKHVVVWEQHHGPVPKKHVVIFRDGDRSNCDIGNLLLVSRDELLGMNRHRLIQTDAELTDAGLALVNLRKAIKQQTREKQQ